MPITPRLRYKLEVSGLELIFEVLLFCLCILSSNLNEADAARSYPNFSPVDALFHLLDHTRLFARRTKWPFGLHEIFSRKDIPLE